MTAVDDASGLSSGPAARGSGAAVLMLDIDDVLCLNQFYGGREAQRSVLHPSKAPSSRDYSRVMRWSLSTSCWRNPARGW